MNDHQILQQIFREQGASELTWEQGARCDCYDVETQQPEWGHGPCGGFGVLYQPPVTIRGIFRTRANWLVPHTGGQLNLGEAQLTTLQTDLQIGDVTYPACRPGYTDGRVRDRFTVLQAVGDQDAGTVFYPVARAVPFMFGNASEAWRVKVSALDQTQRVVPQP